jgi:hypothetical protein
VRRILYSRRRRCWAASPSALLMGLIVFSALFAYWRGRGLPKELAESTK